MIWLIHLSVPDKQVFALFWNAWKFSFSFKISIARWELYIKKFRPFLQTLQHGLAPKRRYFWTLCDHCFDCPEAKNYTKNSLVPLGKGWIHKKNSVNRIVVEWQWAGTNSLQTRIDSQGGFVLFLMVLTRIPVDLCCPVMDRAKLVNTQIVTRQKLREVGWEVLMHLP